ncbi:MAG: hypothetical protein V4558_06855 [Gemmatimonadota bacterium]
MRRLLRLIGANGIAVALVAAMSLSAQETPASPAHAGVAVRFPEGSVHGFLELRNDAGTLIAQGDLLQRPMNGGIESRLRFRFLDGSLFDETATFTQQHVFALQQYHLVQQGPAFEHQLDATLTRAGRYHVTSRVGAKPAEVYDGTLELQPDIANGLVIILAKNLDVRTPRRVQLVAFTPKPRLIELEFVPAGTVRIRPGPRAETAQEFILKPRLGPLVGFFAHVLGKHPPDSRAWIVRDDVPTFLRFVGPMYLGPTWRLDLATPAWPK